MNEPYFKVNKTFYLYPDNVVLVEQTPVGGGKEMISIMAFNKDYSLGDVAQALISLAKNGEAKASYSVYAPLNGTTQKGSNYILSFKENTPFDISP